MWRLVQNLGLLLSLAYRARIIHGYSDHHYEEYHDEYYEEPEVSLWYNPETHLIKVVTDVEPTVSVLWDRIVQSYVVEGKMDKNGPTQASHAYGTMHTAMYDAWTHYVDGAYPAVVSKMVIKDDSRSHKKKVKAMTYAAYLVLKKFFPYKASHLRHHVHRQGFKLGSDMHGTAWHVAKRSAHAVIEKYFSQIMTDEDESPYKDDPSMTEADLWYPERVPIDDPDGEFQSFLTPDHGRYYTFGIKNGASYRPPAPKPFLLVKNAEVDIEGRTITVDGTTLKISRDMIGKYINPEFVDQCNEVIKFSGRLNDRRKLIAEFWEDGGSTSFPPGKWMTIGQYVSARDRNSVDDDAKMFFVLGNAVRDAGIASWNTKMYYYYARPVRAIRQLGHLGLIGHYSESRGGYVIGAYNVPKRKRGTILASAFQTYQNPEADPSPPFAEYTSGHSAFSRAAAEVLRYFTGSDYFGGSITIKAGTSKFEADETPHYDETFYWETFLDASDAAGISRLHGGIHFRDGDIEGRMLGKKVGKDVFARASELFNW